MAFNYKDRTNRWQLMNANLKKHLDELPDLVGRQQEFEGILNDYLTIAAQYNQLTAAARDLMKKRDELAKRANRIRTFFVAALRHHHGPDSQILFEYGIRPFEFKRKKKVEPESPEPSEPIEQAAA
jgi:hypothetical protein